MNVIAEKRWSYVLFDDGKGWVLTLLIGGVVEVDVSVRLTSDEVLALQSGVTSPEKLVEAVKRDRSAFAHREINPPVWP